VSDDQNPKEKDQSPPRLQWMLSKLNLLKNWLFACLQAKSLSAQRWKRDVVMRALAGVNTLVGCDSQLVFHLVY
jgi:hypothetical protein